MNLSSNPKRLWVRTTFGFQNWNEISVKDIIKILGFTQIIFWFVCFLFWQIACFSFGFFNVLAYYQFIQFAMDVAIVIEDKICLVLLKRAVIIIL